MLKPAGRPEVLRPDLMAGLFASRSGRSFNQRLSRLLIRMYPTRCPVFGRSQRSLPWLADRPLLVAGPATEALDRKHGTIGLAYQHPEPPSGGRLPHEPALDGVRGSAVLGVLLFLPASVGCLAAFWAWTRSSCSAAT